MNPATRAAIQDWLDSFSRRLDRDFTAAYRPGKHNAERTTSRQHRAGSRRTKRLARRRR
jgi:hypothetical protein